MPSPLVKIDSGSTITDGYFASAGQTLNVYLVDSSGMTSWDVTCSNTDDSHDKATINASKRNIGAYYQFTVPSEACTLLFTSQVNEGKDVNGTVRADYATSFGVAVLNGAGLRLAAANETFEFSASNGWAKMWNALTNEVATPGSNILSDTGLITFSASAVEFEGQISSNIDHSGSLSGNITFDCNNGQVHWVSTTTAHDETITGNVTIMAPTNARPGSTHIFRVVGDGTHSVAWDNGSATGFNGFFFSESYGSPTNIPGLALALTITATYNGHNWEADWRDYAY